ARHLLMADLRIDSHHLRMGEGRNESEICARRWKVEIAPRFIGLGLESKLVAISLRQRVFAQEIECFAKPLDRLRRVLRSVDFGALAAAPENVEFGTKLGAEIHRVHGLLNGIESNSRI